MRGMRRKTIPIRISRRTSFPVGHADPSNLRMISSRSLQNTGKTNSSLTQQKHSRHCVSIFLLSSHLACYCGKAKVDQSHSSALFVVVAGDGNSRIVDTQPVSGSKLQAASYHQTIIGCAVEMTNSVLVFRPPRPNEIEIGAKAEGQVFVTAMHKPSVENTPLSPRLSGGETMPSD